MHINFQDYIDGVEHDGTIGNTINRVLNKSSTDLKLHKVAYREDSLYQTICYLQLNAQHNSQYCI